MSSNVGVGWISIDSFDLLFGLDEFSKPEQVFLVGSVGLSVFGNVGHEVLLGLVNLFPGNAHVGGNVFSELHIK